MRIRSGNSDNTTLLRQCVPLAKNGFGTVQQQRQRLRRTEWIRQKRTSKHPRPIVSPLAVRIQPFEPVERGVPVAPSQLRLGRAGMCGDGNAAKAMDILYDIASVTGERVRRLRKTKCDRVSLAGA